MSLFIPSLVRATDDNGNPISGATWSFYDSGTLDPLTVYSDHTLETALGPVVTADASGAFVPIYVDDSTGFRAVQEDAEGTTLKDVDPYNSSAGNAGVVLDITDFGIVAGGTDELAEANSDAVDELLDFLLANNPTPLLSGTAALKVTVPAGHFRFARPWVIKFALWLEGQSNSQRFGYATHFDFDEGGFEFHGPQTDHDGPLDPPTTGAAGWRLENIYCSSRAAIGTGHHGLHAVTRGDVIRCTFALFPGDGIRIESITGFGAVIANNANSTRILFCQSGGNGGNGIHLLNGDANCVITQGCDVHVNGEFGIFDNAFLSNHHTGHHAEGNGLGLVYPGHKMGPVGSAATVAIAAWASGVAIALSTRDGTYRMNAGKLYHLLAPGGGNTANAPTHTTDTGVTEADGYKWAYAGTTPYRQYHVVVDQLAAASTTHPETDPTVWVPYAFANVVQTGVPLWVTGMTWKAGGAYCGNSPAGETVWEACYVEGSQPPPQIRSPQIWVGGQAVLSAWSTCVQVRSADGALRNPLGMHAEMPFYNGQPLVASFGAGLSTGRWLALSHPTRHPSGFIGTIDVDVTFALDGVGTFATFTGASTAFTGGRSTAQPGKLHISELFLGSGAAARAFDRGSAAPVSGHHAVGEIRLDTVPTAGGKLGWVCVTAGTPGTWKPFGAIDA